MKFKARNQRGLKSTESKIKGVKQLRDYHEID